MSEGTQTAGTFTGGPATRSNSCCASPTPAAHSPLPPIDETATADPCCGTAEAAQAAGSCCGVEARADAVKAGQGCCG